MEKSSKLCFFFFAVAILASLCACSPQNKPQPAVEMTASTLTPTSAPIVSVTEELDPSVEVPVDETEPYILVDENFEVYNEADQIYHYVGQNEAIMVNDVGLEIHLPDEWVSRVEVIRNASPERTEIYIANVQLMQAYAEMNHDEIQESYGWLDWVLRILAIRKDDIATIEEFSRSEYQIYLGESEKYRIYFSCTDMHHMDCETFLTCRTNMIHNQGQEYYDNLVGDLTCSVEQAREILKVT